MRNISAALSCNTTEMLRRTSSGCATTSSPSTWARPRVGRVSVVRIFRMVVLPAPFGPNKPKSDPGRTEKLIPSTARTAGRRRGA